MRPDIHVAEDLAGKDLNGLDLAKEPSDAGDGGSVPDAGPLPDMTTPQLATSVPFTTSNGPTAIAMGTVNADANADLVVVSIDSNTNTSVLDVLLGSGTGAFTAVTPSLALPMGSSTVSLGDVDQDGFLDALVTSFDANVYVLKGAGNGTFAAPTLIPVNAGGLITDARFADIDGDSFVDIVATDLGDGTTNGVVWVLLNDQTGQFPVMTHSSWLITGNTDATVFRQPVNLRVGQLDADAAGALDIAVLSVTTSMTDFHGYVGVLQNTSTPGSVALTLSTQELKTGLSPVDLRIAPIVNANHADIIVANQGDNSASVYASSTTAIGAVGYGAATNFTADDSPTALSYVDIDGDGFSDILVVGGLGGGDLTIVYGAAGGAFNVATSNRPGNEVIPVGGGPAGITTGLFDGNSSIDVAVTQQQNNSVGVLLNKH